MDSNDNQLIESLFKLYYADLCIYAMRFLEAESLAEDLVSETFYSLWKSKKDLNKIEHIKSYLYKSVHNNCLYYLRSKKNSPQIQDIDFSITEIYRSDVKDALDSMLLKELSQKIENLITKLPPQQQKVFMLKRLENMKNKEIAEELNISVKTVEMHLSKATSFLKQELKPILPLFIVSILVGI